MTSAERTTRATAAGPVLKAGIVALRGTDPHSVPVAQLAADAHQRGYQAGYDEGYQAGALAAGIRLADSAEHLAGTVAAGLAQAEARATARRQADALQLVELALSVAEWAVRRELSSVPDAFFARLAEVLTDCDRSATVEITTSAAMVEPTRRWLDDPSVRVLSSPDLADGEARVGIDDTTVFATFADAFARAREVLDDLARDDEAGGLDDEEETVEVLYDANGATTW